MADTSPMRPDESPSAYTNRILESSWPNGKPEYVSYDIWDGIKRREEYVNYRVSQLPKEALSVPSQSLSTAERIEACRAALARYDELQANDNFQTGLPDDVAAIQDRLRAELADLQDQTQSNEDLTKEVYDAAMQDAERVIQADVGIKEPISPASISKKAMSLLDMSKAYQSALDTKIKDTAKRLGANPLSALTSKGVANAKVTGALGQVGAGISSLKSGYSSILNNISSTKNFLEGSMAGVTQSLAGYAGPEIKAFTSTMQGFFGSNCEISFGHTDLNIKIGTELLALASRIGLTGALKCALSGNILSEKSIGKMLAGITPKITLSGDYRMLQEMLESSKKDVPIRAKPDAFVTLTTNLKVPAKSTQAQYAQAYVSVTTSMDNMRAGWDEVTHGEEVLFDCADFITANAEFKKAQVAYISTLDLPLTPDDPQAFLQHHSTNRDTVLYASMMAFTARTSAESALKRQFSQAFV